MKYDFKGINLEEFSFKLNRVRLEPNQVLDINPQFARQIRKSNDNPRINLVALSFKIESTEEKPKPYDISVTVVGMFELEKEADKNEEKAFAIDATQLLYPYLRAAVTNLTAQAYIMPLNLPTISGPIFPEDREIYSFNPGDVN